MARKLVGTLEEWIYLLTENSCNGKVQWQALDYSCGKWEFLPSMSSPLKTTFGFAMVDKKTNGHWWINMQYIFWVLFRIALTAFYLCLKIYLDRCTKHVVNMGRKK
jgi:hypothetical protein